MTNLKAGNQRLFRRSKRGKRKHKKDVFEKNNALKEGEDQ